MKSWAPVTALATVLLSFVRLQAAESPAPQKPVSAVSQPPDRRELWVPTERLKEVLAKHPKAVVLSRDQYETLLRDAGQERPRTAPAPRTSALTSAKYRGQLQGKAVQFTVTYSIEVLSDDWVQRPLEIPGALIGAVRIDGEAGWLRPGGNPARPQAASKSAVRAEPALLVLRGRGTRTVEVDFAAPVSSQTGLNSFGLGLPASAANSFVVKLPPGLRVESAQPFRIDSTPEATTVTASLPPSQPSFGLSWRSSGTAASQAALEARVLTACTIDAERVSVDQDLTITATLGVLPVQFRLAVPANARVLGLEGAEVAKWTAEGERVLVDLQPGERTTTNLRLRLEVPSIGTAASATVALPLPDIEGVARLSGGLAVTADEGVTVKGIQVDAAMRQTSGATAAGMATYEFTGRPAAPRVTVERVEPRFSADVDTRVEFKPEAIFIERAITLHQEKGEVFQFTVALPAEEELLMVRRPDDSEPDWQNVNGKILVRWGAGAGANRNPVFCLRTRIEPVKWSALDAVGIAFKLGDAKIAGARQITGYIALTADESFRLEAEPSETLEQRDGRTTPVRGEYAWFRRDDFALQVKVARRPGEVLAGITGYALPLEGVLDLHAQIAYEFLHSGARQVRIKVPEKLAANFHFEGPQIAERNLAGDTWTIIFQKALTGAYALQVTAQVAVARTAAEGVAEGESRFATEVPLIVPLDVQRTGGVWAVEANTETEITFTTEGLNELDSLLAPALPGYAPRHRIIGVFEWLGPSYALRLAGVRHAPATVITTIIDRLGLDTVLATSGVERHEARLLLRSAGAQYLDVTLPTGARVLSLLVNDQLVKPVGDRPGVLRVQLPALTDSSAAMLVVMLYETRQGEWGGGGGMEVRAPQFDRRIPVLRSTWRLFLPEGFSYSGLESNLSVPDLELPRPFLLRADSKSGAASIAAIIEGRAAYPRTPQAQIEPMSLYGFQEIEARLARTVIPKLQLREVTVQEAVNFIQQKTGVPMSVPAPNENEARITLSLTNVPASEALQYVANLAGLKVKVDAGQVLLVPASVNTDVIVTKEFKVRPGLLKEDIDGDRTRGQMPENKLRDWLTAQGLVFGPNASAVYQPVSGKIIVRNTQEQLDLFETIVSAAESSGPGLGNTAGFLPLHLDLPKEGQVLTFEGLSAPEHVVFRYDDWWSRARRLWLWFVAGGLACVFGAGARPWWRSAWVTLLLTFFPLVISVQWAGVCNAVLGGWLVALVLTRLSVWWMRAPERKEVLA